MSESTTVKDMRRANRAQLLRHLVRGGESSRSALGEVTGLSPATVTNVISDLIADGIVIEQGQGITKPAGGRPRVLVDVKRDAAWMFGADVGENAVTVGLFDLTMNRIGERTYPFPSRRITPDEVMGLIEQGTIELLAGHRGTRPPVLGLGLGVPGIVQTSIDEDGHRHDVVHAQVIGWESESFDELSQRLGMRVFIDNGAKTTTEAESWFGSIRGEADGIVVLIGTGAGAGIVSNGALVRGSSSSAGEWGHTKISTDGVRCRCGARGCVETFVGAAAVLDAWRERGAGTENAEPHAVGELFAEAETGSPRAVHAVEDLVDHLGIALSNLVNLYNPRHIVLAGWFGDVIATHRLDAVTAAVKQNSLSVAAADVTIGRSSLGATAVALGAAILALDEFISSGESLPGPSSPPEVSRTISPQHPKGQ
ncbi:ROK family transcriptional regulator [Microbacterium gorillae]|uniref:ROK family transcriptional regulator n=1 Tax=Microbacterium gorillae TaxID=1231063 RepID=UPI001141685B|nr:ROK family transcriptional regulator [Microbacterium gorillae]